MHFDHSQGKAGEDLNMDNEELSFMGKCVSWKTRLELQAGQSADSHSEVVLKAEGVYGEFITAGPAA